MTKKQTQLFLTVILPNYNEEENLKRGVLEHVYDYLSNQKYSFEIIVSDDGSTDNSPKLIEKFARTHPQLRLLKNKHAGKPFALRSAINQAQGKFVLLTDMDQSTPIEELEKLLPWVDDGYKVVIGSRGSFRKDAPFYRKLASLVFQLARRSILLPRIVDTQCGFKLLETKLARQIFAKMFLFQRDFQAQGWKVTAYDVEMLNLAKKMGQKIIEVPVVWRDEDVSLAKGRSFIKESLDMLLEIARVRYNDLRGRYA